MDRLDQIIDKVNYIRPFPQAVPQLLTLLARDEVDADAVVKTIAYDPTLTTNVMRLCNSVMFGANRPATDLQEAVLRLGFNEVYQLVLVLSSAGTLMPAQRGYGLAAAELWKHSVASAVAAKVMARDRGDNESLAFTAALLHDIGKVVLAHALEGAYDQVAKEVEQAHTPMVEAERKLLGVHHAEVGGRMLARWKFSAETVAAVWFHHEPALAKPHERLASYLYLANMMAYFMGHGYGHFAFALRGRAEALEILGMNPEELPAHMLQTFDALEKLKPILNFDFK